MKQGTKILSIRLLISFWQILIINKKLFNRAIETHNLSSFPKISSPDPNLSSIKLCKKTEMIKFKVLISQLIRQQIIIVGSKGLLIITRFLSFKLFLISKVQKYFNLIIFILKFLAHSLIY